MARKQNPTQTATAPQSKFNPHIGSEKEHVEWIEAGDMETAKQLAQRVADHLYFSVRARPVLRSLIHFLTNPDKANLDALRKFACDGDLSKLGDAASAALQLPGLGDDEAMLVVNRIHRRGSTESGKRKASGVELFAKMLVPGKPLGRSMFERKWLASFVDLNQDKTMQQLVELMNHAITQNNDARKRRNRANWHPFYPARAITADQLRRAYTEFHPAIDKANGVQRHVLR